MRRIFLLLACGWLAIGLAACDTVRDAAVEASVAPAPVDPVQEPDDRTRADGP